jgi:type IV pilus assembly protein PilA
VKRGTGRTKKISHNFKTVRGDHGFTLIEILIVIAIIGILAAIAIPQLSVYRSRAYNKAAVSDLKNAAIAQEAYYGDNMQYCSSLTTLSAPPYNFYLSDKVDLTIVSADNASYIMEAYHPSGDVTYTASGPGGAIVP